MENQNIKNNDTVELFSGRTGTVLSVDEEKKECVVQIKTIDGLSYERTYSINQVKVL